MRYATFFIHFFFCALFLVVVVVVARLLLLADRLVYVSFVSVCLFAASFSLKIFVSRDIELTWALSVSVNVRFL